VIAADGMESGDIGGGGVGTGGLDQFLDALDRPEPRPEKVTPWNPRCCLMGTVWVCGGSGR
jgi:hypothetical protein